MKSVWKSGHMKTCLYCNAEFEPTKTGQYRCVHCETAWGAHNFRESERLRDKRRQWLYAFVFGSVLVLILWLLAGGAK